MGALIDQAMGPILSQLPATFDERFYDTVKHMVVLYAAILLEGSYHRDKVTDGAVALWHQLLTDGMAVLRKDTGTVDGAGPAVRERHDRPGRPAGLRPALRRSVRVPVLS